MSWWKLDEMNKVALNATGENEGIIHGAAWMNTATHQYAKPGLYNVSLTVWNTHGFRSTAIQSVLIS